MKKYLPLVLIIVTAIALRFIYLGTIPNAVDGDELLYVITAKSIYLTGHDLSGTWNPLSVFLFHYPPNERQAELPYFIQLSSSGPFPFSLLLTKLPFAILSVGVVILLYAITKKLFGKPAGIAAGLIAAINPWIIVMGRTTYEATPAMFFYLLSLYVLLTARAWNILWTVVPLLLAFYSYIGTKIILIPFVILGAFLGHQLHKRYVKQYIVLCLISIVLTGMYLLLVKTSPNGSRIGELFLPSSPIIANAVNESRRAALQFPGMQLLINKYSVYLEMLLSKLFRIFSPPYLFSDGDQFFLPAIQSFLYNIDFIFMILGTLYLFVKNRRAVFILLLFMLIGTFPHLFHMNMGDFSHHLTLLFPFMIIIIGAGITETIHNFPARFRIVAAGIIILLYTLSAVSFIMKYVSKVPLTDYADFHVRILSRYLTLAGQKGTPITVYTTSSGDIFRKYLFYGDRITTQTIPEIRKTLTAPAFTFDGINFEPCDATAATNSATGILLYNVGCNIPIDAPHTSITRLLDAGEIYKIINDTLCSPYQLHRYPENITLNDFRVEQLSTERFCEIYISVR